MTRGAVTQSTRLLWQHVRALDYSVRSCCQQEDRPQTVVVPGSLVAAIEALEDVFLWAFPGSFGRGVVLGDALCPAVADLGMEARMSPRVFSGTYKGTRDVLCPWLQAVVGKVGPL